MTLQVVILIISIIALYFGAELALDAAEKVGFYFGFSPLAIGLVLVGFGTSLPEFFVSQIACLRGESEIALGNIIGSNIANLFLILGISGLITPLALMQKAIKRQLKIHLVLTILLSAVIIFYRVNMMTSILLFGFFSFFLWDIFNQMKKENKEKTPKEEEKEINFLTFVKLILGFYLLYIGGEYLVSSGTELGKLLNIPTYVISAVFVAFGTSFPELVTALIACLKGKDSDLITGNIIGSNIFNVAFVMGSIGFYDISIKQNFIMEVIGLGFASLFLLGLVYLKKNFNKLGGGVFLGVYTFIVYQWSLN